MWSLHNNVSYYGTRHNIIDIIKYKQSIIYYISMQNNEYL